MKQERGMHYSTKDVDDEVVSCTFFIDDTEAIFNNNTE